MHHLFELQPFSDFLMPSLSTSDQQLLNILRTKLIPWTSGGSPFVLLGAPPKAIGSNTVIEEAAAALPTLKGAGLQVHVQVWEGKNLNCISTPYLGCVLEGEADIVTATTAEMCSKLKIPGTRWILNAPAKSFIMTPPKVPVSSGELPHWERPDLRQASSKILWMQFQSTGVSWHFCTTDRGTHWSHPHYFISGTEFLPLAHQLIHEMTLQSQEYLPLVYHYLSILLHQMVRGLLAPSARTREQISEAGFALHALRNDDVTSRAITFIDENLNKRTLGVEMMAAHLQLSSRHLARLFKRDTGLSILAFITKKRMNIACQHLVQSQYTIARIADNSGYTTSSSFVKTFRRHLGISPTAYRIAHLRNVRNKQQMAESESKNPQNKKGRGVIKDRKRV